MTQSTPPGWYPDGQGGQRWWDGNQWTEHTQPLQAQPPDTSDRPAPQQPGQQPGPSDVTQVRPQGDRPAPAEPEQPPAAMPTQVAGAPGTPQQPGVPPQQGYPGAPQQGGFGQQPGYPAQPGQPGQPAWQGQQYAGPTGGGGGVNAKLIALIGGGAALVIILIVIVFVVVGGGGGGSPKDVVQDFVNADSCGDVEDLVTDDFFGDEGCDDSGPNVEGDSDVEVGDEKIDGDKATVEATTEGDFTVTFHLVKDGGDWKIDTIG